MLFPEKFDFFSLPYLFLGSILLWTSLLFLLFFFPIAKGDLEKKEHFYFGLLALFFGGFSLCSGMAYTAESENTVLYWVKIKAFCGLNSAVIITPYAASALRLKQKYFTKYFPLLSFLTLLFFFFPNFFIKPEIVIHSIDLWGQNLTQPHIKLAPFSYVFVTLCLVHILAILTLWLVQNKRSLSKNFATWLALTFFVIVSTHEILITFGAYRFISMATFAFSAFLILMAFKLFRDFIRVNYGLLSASTELQKTNEEMRFLVSTISHDTMAPLLSIRGFVDLLTEENQLKNNENSELHYLHRIQINANHVRALLADLAKYAKIGRIEEKVEPLNLSKTFRQAIEMLHLEHQYPGAKVQLQGHWHDFLGSDKQLKQIITNLIINAIRHANRNDVKIVIDNENEDTQLSQSGLFFSLKDNGPGIPPNLHQKIFRTFYKSDPYSKGSGMGLAIVKKMVTNMGGNIWIDPNYQKGARFCVHLPSLAENR